MSELRELDREIRKRWLEIMSKRLKYGTSGAGDLEWLVTGKNQGKRISQVYDLHIENLELEEQIRKLDNMFSFGIYIDTPQKIQQKIGREKIKLRKELESKQKLLDMAQEKNKVILSIKKQIKDMENKMYSARNYDAKKKELKKKKRKYDSNLKEIKTLIESLERNIFSNERESAKKSASRSKSRSKSRSTSRKRKFSSTSYGGSKRKTRRKRKKRKKRIKRTKKHLKIERKKQRVKTRRRRRR